MASGSAKRSRSSRPAPSSSSPVPLTWEKTTELVGIAFELEAPQDATLYAQYTIGLHAWLLDQVRRLNPKLSATLHDDQTEKAFTLSGLEGNLVPQSRGFRLKQGDRYRWIVTALSKPVTQVLARWLADLPASVDLRNVPLQIQQVEVIYPATTYAQLWEQSRAAAGTVALSFVSPTSFRRRGHHFPLPLPINVFHSYLRRWNLFAKRPVDADEFLDWIEESVLISRHRLESTKVLAGKKGAVTGFTGAIEYELAPQARDNIQLTQLFYALVALAPYCSTGHKTTFGLGQTRSGWMVTAVPQEIPTVDDLLAQRITELTVQFKGQRQRQGGDRATQAAETLATIVARRELGESLLDIAADLEMPYETAKTYAKRARRELALLEPGATSAAE